MRIGHVYGPGEEKYQKLIPNTIRKILSDEPVELYGTGEDLRTLYILQMWSKLLLIQLICLKK